MTTHIADHLYLQEPLQVLLQRGERKRGRGVRFLQEPAERTHRLPFVQEIIQLFMHHHEPNAQMQPKSKEWENFKRNYDELITLLYDGRIKKSSKKLTRSERNEFQLWSTVECAWLPIMHWEIKWRSELCLMPFSLLSRLPARTRLEETHKHWEVASTIYFHPHTCTQSLGWFVQLKHTSLIVQVPSAFTAFIHFVLWPWSCFITLHKTSSDFISESEDLKTEIFTGSETQKWN